MHVLKDTSEEAGDGPVYIDAGTNVSGVSFALNFAPGGVEANRFVRRGAGIITEFGGTAFPAAPDPGVPQTPEPASIILLATGAAIAGAVRRRLPD